MGCAGLAIANVHEVTQEECGAGSHTPPDRRDTVGRGFLSCLSIALHRDVCWDSRVTSLAGILCSSPQWAKRMWVGICSGSFSHPPDFDIGTCSSLQPAPSTGPVLVHPSLPCSTLVWTRQTEKGPGAWRYEPDVSYAQMQDGREQEA